jgi:hypothetical protein
MNIGRIQIERQQQARMLRLKEAVLASFHEPAPSVRAWLAEFTALDWERAKYWLDVSGLALYFLGQLLALSLESCVPAQLLNPLQKGLADNRDGTEDLFSEAAALAEVLQNQKVEFALLIRRPRFHVAEGSGLAVESLRWQRRLTGVSQ